MNVIDFVDKHKGEAAFVCGAGPSLHYVDVEKLKDHVVISVNSSLPKLDFCNYFVADDIGVKNWDYYVDLLPTLDCISFLYRDKLKKHARHLDKNKVVWFHHKWWYSPKDKKYNPEGLVFTKGEPIIGARTTSGTAVHIAYIMGCDPIVLLGCDCCYKNFKRYYWQFPGEKKCKRKTGEKVFCNPNKGKYRGQWVDAHSLHFVKYWDALAHQAKQQGINIIDASDSILECLPKMDIEDIL